MILELDLLKLDGGDAVVQIHRFLEPAKRHLEDGGTVVVAKSGKEIGSASSMEELLRLVAA